MIAFESSLEVREAQPIEIPQCEVVLPMPREWFDAFNAGRRIGPGGAIAAIVSEGHGFINGPGVREDFARIWSETLKPYRRKIPWRGEMVRALIPMRRAVFECLQSVAKSVGSSEHEVALAIIARCLEIEGKMKLPAASATPAKRARVQAGKIVPGPWKPRNVS